MPAGKESGAKSAVGNWDGNRGGASRTERREVCEFTKMPMSANS
jgi:hypothetical protein